LNDFLNSVEIDSNDENSDDEMNADLKIDCSEGQANRFRKTYYGIMGGKKIVYPNLYILVRVVNCVPVMQVSVKMFFLELKLWITDMITNLSSDLLPTKAAFCKIK